MGSSGKTGRRFDSSPIAQLAYIDKVLGHYRHLSNARDFVEKQNSLPVTLATVARAIGISPSQLSRLFREKVGMSFGNWLVLQRVDAAMKLMRERQISASEAATLSGFASYRSFARSFKVIVGIPPSTYRKIVEEELSTCYRR